MISGPNRLPAGGEERPGELEERPRAEDQNVGIRTEAREVSDLPPTTRTNTLLASNNGSVLYAPNNIILRTREYI